MKMSNQVYDILINIAQIGLSAAGTLYFTCAGIWGWPYAEQVVGTIAAVNVFLGTMLKISKIRYNKRREESNDYSE